jgi:hypothetical protein
MSTGGGLDAWVNAYIAYQSAPPQGPDGDEHPYWWAVERSQGLVTESVDPEELWRFILSVLHQRPSQHVLGMLGAGPLEDLVDYFGPAFIDRIEAEALRSPEFRDVLSSVWQSSTPEVWFRVERAVGTRRGEV